MSEKPDKRDICSNDFSRSCPQNLQLKTTEVVTTETEISELEAAKQLAAELDYLPLALEQAAAYIKRLKCSFRDYLQSFRQRGLELLEKTQSAVQYPFSYENCLGTNHKYTVGALEDLGVFYSSCMKFHEAEQCLRHVLTIRQHVLGPEHPDTGQALAILGSLYHKQGKIVEAELNYEQTLAIQRKTLGSENPFTAMAARGLAQVYHIQGKRAEAEALYRYWLTTMEKSALATPPNLIEGLENYADLLRELGCDAEATDLENRARENQP